MEEKENLHKGHRTRMFERFQKGGFDQFNEHEILELMLYYVIPRADTNEVAHRLLKKYKSLRGVCLASKESLLEIPGVGEKMVQYLHILAQFARAYDISYQARQRIKTIEEAVDILRPYVKDSRVEKLYIMILDDANRVLGIEMISEGLIDQITMDTQKIVQKTIEYRGTKVIMAHNHPGSISEPSDSDKIATYTVKTSLESIRATLVDHYIFSIPNSLDEKDYTSVMNEKTYRLR